MATKNNFIDLLKALKSKRMVIVLCLGFSSGLPIMLLYKSLKIWLRREGVDLGTIGYLSWVTVPYSFNFLWAFLFDRFTPTHLGRRRSWLLITQIGIIFSLVGIGFSNPVLSMPFVALTATLLCFFSASQDVVVDAYRREILPESELGVGAAIGVYGYRIAMLVASGFGLWMVDKDTLGLSYNQMFFVMALIMAVGVVTTLFATEPQTGHAAPTTLKEAVVDPFLEFFKRKGAILTLTFILLFKIGDSMAGTMLGSFYVDVGFSDKNIAEITSGLGFLSTMVGLFVGGSLLYQFGYFAPMILFSVLQALSTLSFTLLTFSGPSLLTLSCVVFFEDFSSGMGTAALVAFMSSLANKRFTATQYALFASLASFGRTFFSGFAGTIIQYFSGLSPEALESMETTEKVTHFMHHGYPQFFLFCTFIALPGALLLFKVWKLHKD